MSKKVDEYNVIRVIATLLVVLGHCDFLMSHGFNIGGAISPNLGSYTIFNETIRQWIYSFHMPLFMILSGTLFFIVKDKYSLQTYIFNRVKRLLKPYLLCSVLYAFPIRYLCGYFGEDSLFKAFLKSVILVATPGHLWFLWVLFIVSIITAVMIYKIPLKDKNAAIAYGGGTAILLLISFIIPKGESWFQWSRVGQYFIYYWMGYLFEAHNIREATFAFFRRHRYICSLILLVITIALVHFKSALGISGLLSEIVSLIQAVTGTLFIFGLSTDLVNLGILNNGLYKKLLKNNFEIYLFHEPLQFLLLFLMNLIGVLTIFNSNVGYVGLIAIRFVATIWVSIFMKKIITGITNMFNRS